MPDRPDYAINRPTCEWTVRILGALQRRLRLEIHLHQRENYLASGEIFLFNHFARFETFIPQYLIYQETKAFCRSVAAAEFFKGNDTLANYLIGLGALPNDHPRLLPFLAEEILRGRKVIIFPEGGMVKDRRVVDDSGGYSIYSRTSESRRKHHSGAAVLALNLETLRIGLRSLHASGNQKQFNAWVDRLQFHSPEALLAAVNRPTRIIPGNITFYPIRITDNLLHKGAELFTKHLPERLSEELLIEGNFLLKDTDMDIRLEDPIDAGTCWRWWEKRPLADMVRRLDSVDELFGLKADAKRLRDRIYGIRVGRKTLRVRDTYMHRIYSNVTINLSHVVSQLIWILAGAGRTEIDRDSFHRMLFLAIKNIQKDPAVNLHRSLRTPPGYQGVIDGTCRGLIQYLATATAAGVIAETEDTYRFLPKLLDDHEFDEVRVENPVLVYVNEAGPISALRHAVERAIKASPKVDDQALAKLLFEEEVETYHWEKNFFSLPQYREINDQETATENGEPYLLIPEKPNCLGVVLVHGFLASPAELRAFGEQLYAAGHPVIGVRLKGHGTSPWDLRGRRWQDWLESVRQGYRIISGFSEQVCLVGFSTGGTLSLLLAAEHPPRLAGVAAVSAPIRFRNRNLVFVPLMRGANKLVQLISKSQGVMLFRPNDSEHPRINYKSIPIRGLHELRRIVDALKDRLGDVKCPVCIVQGSDDQVVDPKSASLIRDGLGSDEVDFYMVRSNRHGILNEDIGDTREQVRSFLESTVKSLQKAGTACQIVMGQHHPLTAARQDFPWLMAYPEDVDWFEPVSERRVARYLDKAAARYSDRPCIDFLGRKFNYQEVGDLVNRAAKGFQDLGVGKGVKVGLCLPNTPYFVICYYAILKTGGTVVNYNPLYADRELVHQVEDSETDLMVTLDIGQIYDKVRPLLERTRLQKIVVCPMRDILPTAKGLMFSIFKRSEVATIPDDSGHVLYSDLIDNDGNVEDVAIDLQKDIAVLQYTGGTTGLPKGAMLTHANVSANTEQVYRWFPGMERGKERILVVLPLFHVFAMTAAMNLGIAGGAELILLPRFDLEQVLKTIDAGKPTLFPGVPTLFAAINNCPHLDDYDLSSIKFCISGGAPLTLDVRTRFEDLTGCNLVEGYGLSEASPVVACSPVGGLSQEGSIGIPLPGTVIEIRDRDMPERQLPPGEIGEICVRGPQVMKGYWGKEKETAATIIDDRLHTGDLGYMDEDGYIFLIDRIKDLILCNGYNVYPRVVEEAISLHPAVDEVTVVGVPDDYHGQYPKAFIKLRGGESLSSEALIEFLEDKLSPMERPREIEFRDELPKSLIGKLSKKELVSEEMEKSTAEHA